MEFSNPIQPLLQLRRIILKITNSLLLLSLFFISTIRKEIKIQGFIKIRLVAIITNDLYF
jgi:hypothetical protein